MKKDSQSHHGRRAFVKSAAGLGAAALTTGVASMASPGSTFAQSGGDSPDMIMNFAATVETFVITHLTNLLSRRTFHLSNAEELQARVLLAAEMEHLNFLTANGGRAATNQFFFPSALYSDRRTFAVTTAELETVCTALYLAASRRFAELGNPRLAATQGQIACSEAQHVVVARDLIEVVPSDIAWAVPAFYNVSDAQPILAPYLAGGGNKIGPLTAPSGELINRLVGNARSILVVPPPLTRAF